MFVHICSDCHKFPSLKPIRISALAHSLLEEGMDWRTALYFVHVHITVRAALALCSQLITPVWGLVTGHHQQALCCCQEPFTPSSFSPNGTSESIKTIITASPTESKEIILGGQGKHRWGVWIYLSRERLDVHLARQPVTFSIFCIRLVWIHWWLQHNFLQHYEDNSFQWTSHYLSMQILHLDHS